MEIFRAGTRKQYRQSIYKLILEEILQVILFYPKEIINKVCELSKITGDT